MKFRPEVIYRRLSVVGSIARPMSDGISVHFEILDRTIMGLIGLGTWVVGSGTGAGLFLSNPSPSVTVGLIVL